MSLEITYFSIFFISFFFGLDDVVDLCNSVVPAVIDELQSLSSHGAGQGTFHRCVVIDVVWLKLFTMFLVSTSRVRGCK